MVEIGIIALAVGGIYKIKKIIDKNMEQSREKKYAKIKNETLKELFVEVERKKLVGEIKEKDVPLVVSQYMIEEMTKNPHVYGKEIEQYIQKNMNRYQDELTKEKMRHNEKMNHEKRVWDKKEKEPNYSYAKDFMMMEEKLKSKDKEDQRENKRA